MFNKIRGPLTWPGRLSSWLFSSCSLCLRRTDFLVALHRWHAFSSLRPSHRLAISCMDSPFSALLTPPVFETQLRELLFQKHSDLCSRVLSCHGTCCFPCVPTEPHRHTSNSAFIILIRDGLDFLAHLFIRP